MPRGARCCALRQRRNGRLASQRHCTLLLFGAPGAGKGTQGKILGQIPGFIHLSMGDVFRALDPTSRLGKVFSEYSSRGELVPDDVTIQIWSEHVDGLIERGKYRRGRDVLVLDGIPRNVNQAGLLDDQIDVLRVVHLAAKDENKMIERLRKRALRENRVDDAKEAVVRRRLEIYRAETQPVLDHYERSLVADVDAIGAPSMVLLEILKAVAPAHAKRVGNALED